MIKMNFIDALRESVDEALSILGTESKQVVYDYLENNYSLHRASIPHRIDEFSKAIELLFGTAAIIIQTQIMKSLFKRINEPINMVGKPNELDFTRYIQSARVANVLAK